MSYTESPEPRGKTHADILTSVEILETASFATITTARQALYAHDILKELEVVRDQISAIHSRMRMERARWVETSS